MKKILILFFIIIFGANLLAPLGVSASPSLKDAFNIDNKNNNDPLDKIANTAGYKTDSAKTQLNDYVSLIISTILSILGVLFMILLIYGSFLWITDQGNTTQVDKAKKLIAAAIVGLIIILLSYAISIFVFQEIGTEILTTG